MRELFETQLKELNRNLNIMGTMCVDCITFATQAVLTDEKSVAEKSKQLEIEIDDKQREIESLCTKIILKQQPVASDLRNVTNALKMITDMERIGDQGSDIAEITRHVSITQKRNSSHIAQMADAVINMIINAVRAFVDKDEALAKVVIDSDDIVDSLFFEVRGDLVKMICSGEIHESDFAEEALSTLMIAKYLERIGDHIVNVAECV